MLLPLMRLRERKHITIGHVQRSVFIYCERSRMRPSRHGHVLNPTDCVKCPFLNMGHYRFFYPLHMLPPNWLRQIWVFFRNRRLARSKWFKPIKKMAFRRELWARNVFLKYLSLKQFSIGIFDLAGDILPSKFLCKGRGAAIAIKPPIKFLLSIFLTHHKFSIKNNQKRSFQFIRVDMFIKAYLALPWPIFRLSVKCHHCHL